MTAHLVRPQEGDAVFGDVLLLAKTARKTVGFLTDSAFAQRAQRGTLLAAVANKELAGYILYDLPRDEIRIVQLVIAEECRGSGFARTLVDAVASDHAERRGILLTCRNDFPADRMWPRLDFVPVNERVGRSIEGKTLTRWFRSFGQPDLFTFLHEDDSRPIAAMDACVFFDLFSKRPKAVAEQLRADWLAEHVRLGVTDQLLIEIRDGKDQAERARQRAAADSLRLTPRTPTAWKSVHKSLLAAHPDAPAKDQSDLTYLAQAIAAQATWLITSDRPFQRRYGASAAELGALHLTSPAEFVREVDEQASGERYRPSDLADTSVTRREADSSLISELDAVFVNHPAGERIRDLRRTIEGLAGRPNAIGLEVIEVDGEPRGLICWQLVKKTLEVRLARVTTGRAQATIARHLLGLVRDRAVDCNAETIRILDAQSSLSVQQSYRDEGFATAPSGVVVAHALSGRGTFDELRARATALGSPLAGSDLLAGGSQDLVVRAAAAERWFAPFRVLGAEIPSFVVPIQHGWASQLLDIGLAQDQLIPREWGLGLRRELVYYKSPRNAGGLAAPARLLWYVSGSAPGAGTIRAVSHLTEVAVDDHERLFHRFRALGVYRREDVTACADRAGKAMALRFSHTERLTQPVTLDAYRALISGDPKSKNVVLRSARPISEHMFVSIIDKGAGLHV